MKEVSCFIFDETFTHVLLVKKLTPRGAELGAICTEIEFGQHPSRVVSGAVKFFTGIQVEAAPTEVFMIKLGDMETHVFASKLPLGLLHEIEEENMMLVVTPTNLDFICNNGERNLAWQVDLARSALAQKLHAVITCQRP